MKQDRQEFELSYIKYKGSQLTTPPLISFSDPEPLFQTLSHYSNGHIGQGKLNLRAELPQIPNLVLLTSDLAIAKAS